jgi:hypothetical protein
MRRAEKAKRRVDPRDLLGKRARTTSMGVGSRLKLRAALTAET